MRDKKLETAFIELFDKYEEVESNLEEDAFWEKMQDLRNRLADGGSASDGNDKKVKIVMEFQGKRTVRVLDFVMIGGYERKDEYKGKVTGSYLGHIDSVDGACVATRIINQMAEKTENGFLNVIGMVLERGRQLGYFEIDEVICFLEYAAIQLYKNRIFS